MQIRAGSRIFHSGRGPILGGFGLQRGHFSVKMYAKTKELGPVGGRAPARPPRSAHANFIYYSYLYFRCGMYAQIIWVPNLSYCDKQLHC